MAKITIKDIALEAGVSTSLVSFVMNGKGREYRVSEQMIAHIQEVAQRLQYRPNASARALRSGKTNTIGVIVSDISNPFFAEIVRCIEDLAFEKGWSVLFGSSDENPLKLERLVNAIQNKGVDGWIIVPCAGVDSLLTSLAESGVPMVMLERHFPKLHLPTVCLQNELAAQIAVEHLIHNGYRHIQVLSYELPIQSLLDRESGYTQALITHQMEHDIRIHRLPFKLPSQTTHAGYLESMLPLLQNADALICLTARLSLMSLKAFRIAGVQMPRDMGFVGFDANNTFDLVDSAVTYIHQKPQEFGSRSFEMLAGLLERRYDVPTLVQLTPELISGSSSLPRGNKPHEQGTYLKEKFVQSINTRHIPLNPNNSKSN